MLEKEMKNAYNVEYMKKQMRQFIIALNRDHDAEIIEWLEDKKPITGYIRNLVIEDMRSNGVDIADRQDARIKSGFYSGWRKKHQSKE